VVLIGCQDVIILALNINSMPTLHGVDDQRMTPTIRDYFLKWLGQWETLDAPNVSKNLPLMADTNKCKWAISNTRSWEFIGDDEAAELNKCLPMERTEASPKARSCGFSIADKGQLIRVSKQGPVFTWCSAECCGDKKRPHPPLCATTTSHV
jgi:hypothetical protein